MEIENVSISFTNIGETSFDVILSASPTSLLTLQTKESRGAWVTVYEGRTERAFPVTDKQAGQGYVYRARAGAGPWCPVATVRTTAVEGVVQVEADVDLNLANPSAKLFPGARLALVVSVGAKGGAAASLYVEKLRQLRFVVTEVADPVLLEMKDAISDWGRTVASAKAPLLAFAFFGPGAQNGQGHYMLPADAKVFDYSELPFEAVALTSVYNVLNVAKPEAVLIVLDLDGRIITPPPAAAAAAFSSSSAALATSSSSSVNTPAADHRNPQHQQQAASTPPTSLRPGSPTHLPAALKPRRAPDAAIDAHVAPAPPIAVPYAQVVMEASSGYLQFLLRSLETPRLTFAEIFRKAYTKFDRSTGGVGVRQVETFHNKWRLL